MHSWPSHLISQKIWLEQDEETIRKIIDKIHPTAE